MIGRQMGVSEFVWAVLFSSLYVVIVPALGMATGAVAGRMTPTVSTSLGAFVGLASGVVAMGLVSLGSWVVYIGGYQPPPTLEWVIFLAPMALAVLAPPVACWVIRVLCSR